MHIIKQCNKKQNTKDHQNKTHNGIIKKTFCVPIIKYVYFYFFPQLGFVDIYYVFVFTIYFCMEII